MKVRKQETVYEWIGAESNKPYTDKILLHHYLKHFNMKKTIISLVIIIGLLSCEKEDTQKPDSGLIGTWEWIRTDGGFAFHIHKIPSSTGNFYLLRISSENKIDIYANETEIFSGAFVVEKEESIYSSEKEDYLKIIGEYQIQDIVITGIIKIDNNTLSINDNCYDGIGSSYIRRE